MPELALPSLPKLAAEVGNALGAQCSRMEACRITSCPDLSQPPFNLGKAFIGQLIYIVPSVVAVDEACRQIAGGKVFTTVDGFHIISDGRSSKLLCVEMIGISEGWKRELKQVVEKHLGNAEWEMICIETRGGHTAAEVSLLNRYLDGNHPQAQPAACNGKAEAGREKESAIVTVWLMPVNRRIVAGSCKSPAPCVTNGVNGEAKTGKTVIKRRVPKKAGPANKSTNLPAAVNSTAVAINVPVKLMNTSALEETYTTTSEGGEAGEIVENGTASPIDLENETDRGNNYTEDLNNATSLDNHCSKHCSPEAAKLTAAPSDTFKAETLSLGVGGVPSSSSECKPTGKAREVQASTGKRGKGGGGGLVGKITAMFNGRNQPLEQDACADVSPVPMGTLQGCKNLQNGIIDGVKNVEAPIDGLTPASARERTLETNTNQMAEPSTSSAPITCVAPITNNEKEPVARIVKARLTEQVTLPFMSPLVGDEESGRGGAIAVVSFSNYGRHSLSTCQLSSDGQEAACAPNNLESNRSTSRVMYGRASKSRTLSLPPPQTALFHGVANAYGALPRQRRLSPSYSLSVGGHRRLSPISSDSSLPDDESGQIASSRGEEQQDEDDRTLCLSEQLEDTSLLSPPPFEAEDGDLQSFGLPLGSHHQEDFSLASSLGSDLLTVASQPSCLRPVIRNGPLLESEGMSNGASDSRDNRRAGEMEVLSTPTSIGAGSSREMRKEMMRGMAEVPVGVLQQVLTLLSFKELAELRRVHPHWDEICGQFLNTGYYQLIGRADRLLIDCQRRVHLEKRLAKPVQVLTNLQVHVLNPVDMLRAPMDEGVLCFPYGLILDKAFVLIEEVEQMIESEDDNIDPDWKSIAELSRRAQLHYKRHVAREAERRMSEVSRLSAMQRLQRLDSFLSEANNAKLEKIVEKSRDDLGWEIDALKNQNKTLKKDNRELKQTCARLDARIEVIERKLKTMARLLQ